MKSKEELAQERSPFHHSYNFQDKALFISGDFRSGFCFAEFQECTKGLRVDSIDLVNVSYMDSDSMNHVGLMEQSGCVVVWDELSMPYKRYMDKFN